MTDYTKLSKNTIAYLCRRYGHKKTLGNTECVCARCGHTWAFSTDDLLCKYFEINAMKRLLESINYLKPLPKSKGMKLTFNAWKPLEQGNGK